MVKIAIAGGSGQVSREIIDALQESKKHEITILSRKEASVGAVSAELQWKTVNYDDKENLVEALRGIHTLLSFVQILSDPDQKSQKNLIDAAITAGVKRFAPSEYGSKGTDDMAWWVGKEKIREYLKKVNEEKEILEYTLFQPGFFLDYLAFPFKTSKHVDPLQSIFDFQNSRAVVAKGHENATITLTTVGDIARLVACAVEYEGKWPSTGGIRGNRLTISEIIEIGGKVRGKPFTVEKLNIDDLEAGNLKATWGVEAVHRAVPVDEASALFKTVITGILLSSSKGAWDISNEWNELLPGFEFTSAEEFLRNLWSGKP